MEMKMKTKSEEKDNKRGRNERKRGEKGEVGRLEMDKE